MRTAAEALTATPANGGHMGHVLVTIKVENVADWMAAQEKKRD